MTILLSVQAQRGAFLPIRLTEDGRFSRSSCWKRGAATCSIWIQMPIGYGRTFFRPAHQLDVRYRTGRGTWADGAAIGRVGKVIGGSGSINAMVYVRGQPRDFRRLEGARQSLVGDGTMCCPISKNPKILIGTARIMGAAGHSMSRTFHLMPILSVIVLSRQHRHSVLPASSDFNGAQT